VSAGLPGDHELSHAFGAAAGETRRCFQEKFIEMLDEEVARSFQVVRRYPAEFKLVLDRFLSHLRKRPAGDCRTYLDDFGSNTHLLKYCQQFLRAGDWRLLFAVYQAEELG
jgi:uncharacterized coiled-coil protein SlyX